MYNCKEKQNTNNNSGVPTGTIINFFGDTAPEGYLSCDGTEYLKSDYPLLATHLASLTTANLYVGSDSDHFKVPDLRGEFIRGSGTNGHSGQGNGNNVGIHQDNGLPNITGGFYSYVWDTAQGSGAFAKSINNSKGVDGSIAGSEYDYWSFDASKSSSIYGNSNYVTPTNTSVLYCIKY